MNSIGDEFDELARLCDALIDGSLLDNEKNRLSEIVAQSEPARQFYVRYLGLSASLLEYAGEHEFPAPEIQPAAASRHRRSKWWWLLTGLATTAAIVLAMVWHGSSERDAEADAEEFAAQITGLENCAWANSNSAPKLGDQLPHGQHLELNSGVAEITFDSGAEVTIEGPATLDLNSAWEATLHRGKLRAEVPAAAVGFGIHSATVDVVDLGTQFGMAIDSSGATDVCVLAGAVEATPRNTVATQPTKFVLNEQSARRFHRTGSEEIKNTANLLAQLKLPAKLKRLAKSTKFVHWSFDESAGRIAAADGTWPAVNELGATIETSGDAMSTEPGVAGRWHGALRFDGNLHAHAAVPGFSTRAPHTVAFWVRIPSDAPLAGAGPMVAWLTKSPEPERSQAVQIGWNSNPAEGPLGALRTELGRMTAIGSSNLRDGQWHHIAVVVVPRNTGKQHWHIKQYVDGHLEVATGKNIKKPRADSIDQPTDDVVWLGCRGNNAELGRSTFRGELDELLIADRALPPQLIAQLFQQNSLAGLTAIGDE
jgi:Concanavalin A-like lectin/glucanases superfamily/FecR protein